MPARVRGALVAGLAALGALLAVLAVAVGLGAAGVVAGLTCGVVVSAAVARSPSRGDALGPADLVTLGRALLACAVAALVADALLGAASTGPMLTLAVVALLLDAADGQVARRTGTTSSFGARFDGEADAFLLLVLSVHVAPLLGWWVLVIGAARYVFWLAGLAAPWLRAPLPFRYWRKVVAAVQGVVLVVAAGDVVDRSVAQVALVTAVALLTESFGRDVLWLWRRRREDPDRTSAEPARDGQAVR